MLSSQTLYDLDIFSKKGTACLFDKLNYCKTKGGENKLREICLLNNLTSEYIKERQLMVKYVLSIPDEPEFKIMDNEIYYFTEYLNSKFEILIKKDDRLNRLLAYKFVLFKPHEHYFILSGIKQVLSILNNFWNLYSTLNSKETQSGITKYLDEAKHYLSKLEIDNQSISKFLNNEPSYFEIYALDKKLRATNKDDLIGILNIYYELESLFSLAKAHRKMELTFPIFSDDINDISLTELKHPLVLNCVPNSIAFGYTNLLLLTGPNMGGKSTYMKSIGIAFFMSYLGIGVFAKGAKIPIVDYILTSIKIEDDIDKGYSFFFSEIQNVKHIATLLNSEDKVLVLADELFKGTNVKDAIDCSRIVLKGFQNFPNGVFIFSTHLTELVQEFTAEEALLKFFDATVSENSILFDYKVKDGISDLRIGIPLLRHQNIFSLLKASPKNKW